MEQPPKLWTRSPNQDTGTHWNPLVHAPPGVLRGSTTELQGMERASWGGGLAIGIACFTTPPPLTGDQTHTHTHTHHPQCLSPLCPGNKDNVRRNPFDDKLLMTFLPTFSHSLDNKNAPAGAVLANQSKKTNSGVGTMNSDVGMRNSIVGTAVTVTAVFANREKIRKNRQSAEALAFFSGTFG